MSQKRNRKPIGHVDWLRVSRGSLYEKGFGIRSVSKLTLGFQTPFSVCFATPDGVAVRPAAGWTCALLSPQCASRSFFPQEKRRPQRAVPANPKPPFGWVWEGLWAPKPPPNVLLSPFTAPPQTCACAAAHSSQAAIPVPAKCQSRRPPPSASVPQKSAAAESSVRAHSAAAKPR